MFDLRLERQLGDARISLTLPSAPGLTVLFGPSGLGKTSILHMVAGLLRPDAGHIRVGKRILFDARARIDVPADRRHAGYVFQEPRLFPHRRVRANLSYGAPAGAAKLDAIAAMLGIDGLLDRWPAGLSGGEAKRVAIGRALLSDPNFLLLDEPLASLDRTRAEDVMAAIEHVRDAQSLPILLVTHDRAEAERLGDRIVEMRR